MVQSTLTDIEVEALCVQIDQQLQALYLHEADGRLARSAGEPPPGGLPYLQQRAIAAATGVPAGQFWTRFRQAACRDLCQPEGLLFQQWHKWGDLKNQDVVRTFAGLLTGLGIGGQVLPGLIVATAVIVLHLGIRAVCEKEKAP